ncbi:hypothetical protein BDV59DRAFT_118071 [Aspergillus ambiguus]|uniref:Zn(II)2Cys6 transcription factor domain-containing protein n=1 Tax=Aspergillus ambiguus TaxID=176160 RepID=UPI003CCCD19C
MASAVNAPSGSKSSITEGVNVEDVGSLDEVAVPTPTSASLSTPRALGSDTNQPDDTGIKKARRVRTGCLTCRERHLKCDEAQNQCQNCRKSGRICRRGVRLNFIDTQVSAPPHYIVPPAGNRPSFRDESRHIASEYVGGLERYPSPQAEVSPEKEEWGNLPLYSGYNMPTVPSFIPDIAVSFSGHAEAGFDNNTQPVFHQHQGQRASSVPFHSARQERVGFDSYTCLEDPEEILLLQVFVEEVGLWMDSMDEVKHFTHVLPYHALKEPMLLRAFMACGARHIFLVNPSYGEEKAAFYHDAASRDLLSSLQNPNRDSALCATTAVILNAYELMCSRSILSLQGLNHIAGARALIKECRWNAQTQGLGGACFWLNVGMELLSCLQFNWTLAWDPDTWGVEMDLDQTHSRVAGNEETWTHWMVYICAKVANFRSSMPHFLDTCHAPDSSMHVNQRYQEWCAYNEWCERWENAAPRSLKPLGYLQNWQSNTKSAFPSIWLIKQSSTVARLFYHTTQILLTKTHPFESEFSPEMHDKQQRHAHDVCGIVAHTKSRGVASLSIRFLAFAAGCLTTREAQEEILGILDGIISETGWQAEHIKDELQAVWGWTTAHKEQSIASVEDAFGLLGDLSSLDTGAIPDPLRMPPGIVNPVMEFADFSMENHPYQEYYVPPHHQVNHYQYGDF